MNKEMADGGSPDIGEANATPRVENQIATWKEPDLRLKAPGYRKPNYSLGTKIKVAAAAGMTAFLAACGIDHAQTPNPTASLDPFKETSAQPWTPTKAATATETKTATLTPEIAKIDAFDMSTWTTEMRNYFLGLGSDASKNSLLPLTDAQFDQQLTEAMRFGLLQRGVTEINVDGQITDTKEASEQILLWGYLKEAAKEQKEVYLSKDMIIKIYTDKNLGNIPHWMIATSEDKSAEYGLWAEFFDNAAEKLNMSDLAGFQQFSTKVDVYGTEVSTPYFPSEKTFGDYAGFVRLPGQKEEYAILTRIKDQAGHSYLKIDSIAIKDPVKFDPSMHECIGTSVGGHEMYCPNYQVVTEGVDYPADDATAKLWTKEQWLSRLTPEFSFIILKTANVPANDPERKHAAVIFGFLNPNNGLVMVKIVVISPSSSSDRRLNKWPNPAN